MVLENTKRNMTSQYPVRTSPDSMQNRKPFSCEMQLLQYPIYSTSTKMHTTKSASNPFFYCIKSQVKYAEN